MSIGDNNIVIVLNILNGKSVLLRQDDSMGGLNSRS